MKQEDGREERERRKEGEEERREGRKGGREKSSKVRNENLPAKS